MKKEGKPMLSPMEFRSMGLDLDVLLLYPIWIQNKHH